MGLFDPATDPQGATWNERDGANPPLSERRRATEDRLPEWAAGWGLSPKQERENQTMLAAADERNRQHAEECQARHAANLKRWNSPKPLNDGLSRIGRIYHMDYI